MSDQTDPVETKGRWTMILDREMATYQSHLPELLETAAGKYVLIQGDDVAGVWDTREQALDEGYERFDLKEFLVKRIVAHEEPIFVPREIA